jgi:hypothetical protein
VEPGPNCFVACSGWKAGCGRRRPPPGVDSRCGGSRSPGTFARDRRSADNTRTSRTRAQCPDGAALCARRAGPEILAISPLQPGLGPPQGLQTGANPLHKSLPAAYPPEADSSRHRSSYPLPLATAPRRGACDCAHDRRSRWAKKEA